MFICRPTVELTRRRDFTPPSPNESSYETRSRRSRPTICWARDQESPDVLCPLLRRDPDHITQLLAAVFASDLPATGSRHIDADCHLGIVISRACRVRHLRSQQRASVAIEPSSCDF